MGDTRISNYTKVRGLVSKGITSPSVVISKVPDIKNWRTARKYIKQAAEELLGTYDVISRENEYLSMVESLRKIKGDLITKMEEEKNPNQYFGILKYLIKIDEQFIKLTNLSNADPSPKDFRLNILD
jgi:hypothetical protein